MLSCVIPYGVRLLFRPYAMQLGELREVRESFSSYNPGLGSRRLISITSMSRTQKVSQHCSQYRPNNSCLTASTCNVRHVIIRYQRRQCNAVHSEYD